MIAEEVIDLLKERHTIQPIKTMEPVFDYFSYARAIEGEAIAESRQEADDLKMLIKRLARSLSKAAPDNDLSKKALDYLHRAGLNSSPLR